MALQTDKTPPHHTRTPTPAKPRNPKHTVTSDRLDRAEGSKEARELTCSEAVALVAAAEAAAAAGEVEK